MRVALFGGSFDPPHKAHIEIIKKTLKILNVDKLIVMPTFLNPFKKEFFAPPKLRLKWLRELVKDYDGVEVSEFEISQNRAVSAIESVEYLNSCGFSIEYFIIGADNLKNLNKWNRFEELNKLVEFVIVSRDNITISKEFKTIEIDIPISSTDLREELKYDLIPKEILTDVKKYYKESYEPKSWRYTEFTR